MDGFIQAEYYGYASPIGLLCQACSLVKMQSTAVAFSELVYPHLECNAIEPSAVQGPKRDKEKNKKKGTLPNVSPKALCVHLLSWLHAWGLVLKERHMLESSK